MANDYFHFKQFTIHQEQCAMKVGTDGVLLGSWVDLTDCRHVLDIGTGTGLIALMVAQRSARSYIDAVEIDFAAYRQAVKNVEGSKWKERIRVHRVAIQDFYPEIRYDMVLCNPPFFARSMRSPEHSRTIARHCDALSYVDLLNAARRLSVPSGRLCVILPVVEAQSFICLARSFGWYVNKLTNVFPTPTKPRKRCLLELSGLEATPLESDITLEIERHKYHESFLGLIKDFYLHV